MKLISWNVNGIRAVLKKGFGEWLQQTQPDFLFLQEIKAYPHQIDPAFLEEMGYHYFWHPAQKAGYSGTAAFCKVRPLTIELLNEAEFDDEGRCQILEFEKFLVFNCYFPNSQEGGKRIDYKIRFCDSLLQKAQELKIKHQKGVIICGDYNIAHKPIDLANPKSNEKNPGYLPEERDWMEKFIQSGFVDSFRKFNQEPGQYTWWTYRFNARQNNIGWRIDYFCTDAEFAPQIKNAEIFPNVLGSDHCPVSLEI